MSQLPWYKWFVRDWLTSETRFGMTLAERGLYRDLLDIHYSEGSIPADVRKLRAMVGAHKGFTRAWGTVQQFFDQHPTDPSRLVNLKALQVIENRIDSGEASRKNGALGGRPKGSAKKPVRLSTGSSKKPLARASDTDTDTDTDTSLSNERDTPKPSEPARRGYGEFKSAMLSDDEYQKLQARLGGQSTAAYIARFDRWVSEAPTAKAGGVKRRERSAYRTILNWFDSDGAKPKQNGVSSDGRTKQQQRDDADDAAFLQALAEECDDRNGPSWVSEDLSELRRDGDSRSSQALLPIAGRSG